MDEYFPVFSYFYETIVEREDLRAKICKQVDIAKIVGQLIM